MQKDVLTIPHPLLETDARTLWVFANLLAKADENGNAAIKVNSWCNEIGLSRQQLRTTLKELATTNYITNLATNSGTNGKTNLTICSKVGFKGSTPIKKPIRKPIIEAEKSSYDLSFVNPIFADAFTEWLNYKKKQFKFEYKTERSLKAAYSELVKLSENNPELAMQIVEQSMSNGWKAQLDSRRGTDVGNRTQSDYGGPF